jgi:hypothetical protein
MRRLALALVVFFGTVVQAQDRDVASTLRDVSAELVGLTVPDAAAFTRGDRLVAAADSVAGPIAVVGTVRIEGIVIGDVFAVNGDIIVAAGAQVVGNVVAIGGTVRLIGGTVSGERRTIGGALTPTAPLTGAQIMQQNVSLTLGWAAVVLLIGVGVLVFGGRTLDTVGQVVDEQFGRSFVVGVLAMVGAIPALVLACVGLALTIIGILLIPFLVVASVLAAAGLLALGFLAAARVTGSSFIGARRGAAQGDRTVAVRALLAGVLFYTLLWLTVALLSPFPTLAAVTRLSAFAITWAAVTVGLGATILSRGGTQVPWSSRVPPAPVTGPPTAASWQTPTPISGVAAVRRPTATTRSGS